MNRIYLIALGLLLAGTTNAQPVDLFAPDRTTLLGDDTPVRAGLAAHGITLLLSDVEEMLGNTRGGRRQGATYDALTTLTLQLDTQKAFGWAGGQFNVSALQIRGRNLSLYYLGDLQTASGIAATPTMRLWEAWYQQQVIEGVLDLKAGLQSIDQEFMASQGAAMFVNTAMGWPMVPSADLYAGGPAYPLSSLGARVRWKQDNLSVVAGVFQDNPPGGRFAADGQLLGASRWGGNFNVRTGALAIAELQYAVNPPDAAGKPQGLAGTYKLGFWYDTAAYTDQRFDMRGLSLANPLSSGVPRADRGNFSLYAVADQTLWQAADGPMALGVFIRPQIAPSDRNQVDFSVNGGVTLKAPLPGRENDSLGLGFGVARVSSSVLALAQDSNGFSQPTPKRGAETFVELTYQWQVAQWWQIQPDIQYRWLPGGGAASPTQPAIRLGNELILGVRTTITF